MISTEFTPTNIPTNEIEIKLIATPPALNACRAAESTVRVTFESQPNINIVAPERVCANTITLRAEVSPDFSGRWSTSNPNDGVFSSTNEANVTFTLNQSTTISSVDFTFTIPASGSCPPFSKNATVQIAQGPTVDAGPDQYLCSPFNRVELGGGSSVENATWSIVSGGGSLSIETNKVYYSLEQGVASATIVLEATAPSSASCPEVSDRVSLFFKQTPSVVLGEDFSVCADNISVPISGIVTGAQSVEWTRSGDGSFSNANNSSSTYSPGPNDIISGRARLTLTTVDNGNCQAASDNIDIIIRPAIVVDAGRDFSVCRSNAKIELSGSLEGITEARWATNGESSISPSETSLTASYIPTAADIAKGSLSFYLSSVDHGQCEEVKDTVIVAFTNSAGVDAGPDQIICKNNNNVRVLGKISGTNAIGTWVTLGGGAFTDPPQQLINQYVPDVSDFNSGTVKLVLKVSGDGDCASSADTLEVTFTPAPIITLGEDTVVCADNRTIVLKGKIENAAGGIWSTLGFGSFSDELSATTAYFPTAEDIEAGNVTVTLKSTNNANCASASEDLKISFISSPIINAGEDVSICSSNTVITLEGSISMEADVIWTSNGSGKFSPNSTSLKTAYELSEADIAAGGVELILKSSVNSSCAGDSDTLKIGFKRAPEVTLAANLSVCTSTTSIPLSGEVSYAGGLIWSTSGSGSFSDAFNAETSYMPTPSDISLGNITVTLTSTDHPNCETASGQQTISFSASPTVEAGPDISVCANGGSVNLKGSISSPSSLVWSTTGTGTFSPNNTSLEPIYTLSSADMSSGNITLKLSTKPIEGCQTVSDELIISIFDVAKQPLVTMESVTKSRDDKSSNILNFQVLYPESMQLGLQVQRRSILPFQSEFINIGSADVSDVAFRDQNLPNPDGSYEYVIFGKNKCGEEVKSIPHHTIMLTSQETAIDTTIILQWNDYSNWPQGVERYEIYINQVGEGSVLYESIGGEVTQISYTGSRKKTPPCFVVKAIGRGDLEESWSNNHCIEYPKEALDIPYGISPNNDGKNDVWDIRNIEKYDNEVTIFNQWDNKVYYRKGYKNDFDGNNLPDGQYYFSVKYDQKQQKGPLLIVR
jgi:gliding motility-associated-like protein